MPGDGTGQERHHRDPRALDEEAGENVTAHSTGTTPSSLAKHSRLAVSRKARTKGWPAISRVVAPYRSLHSPFLPMRRAITYSQSSEFLIPQFGSGATPGRLAASW